MKQYQIREFMQMDGQALSLSVEAQNFCNDYAKHGWVLKEISYGLAGVSVGYVKMRGLVVVMERNDPDVPKPPPTSIPGNGS